MRAEPIFDSAEKIPTIGQPSDTLDQPFSIMQDATTVPRDRRRSSRRHAHRRTRSGSSSKEARAGYRRNLFDRRGMQFSCKTTAALPQVLEYLQQFDRCWNLSGLDQLQIQPSIIDDVRWCLEWHLSVDDVSLSWRSMALRLPESSTITLQALGGDLDVFEGRIWAETLAAGTQIHFNLVAAFGLGSFERLVGNLFRQRCEKVFRKLILKWKDDLDKRS